MLAYRTATIDDLAALKTLGLAAYGPYETVLEPEHWKKFNSGLHDEDELAALIAKSTVFVCEDENNMVGAAFFVPHGNPGGFFSADWCYIRRVGVHPGYQGMGIAQRLTQICVEHARNAGEKTIALHTSEFMDAARHIYEKAGFCRQEESKELFGKKYWVYLMKL